MPREITWRKSSWSEGPEQITASVATTGELLDFANKVRKCGGGDPIPALLPSQPGNSKSCLIANALNFQSTVSGFSGGWSSGGETLYSPQDRKTCMGVLRSRSDGTYQWAMDVGSEELALKIAKGMNLPLAYESEKLLILLPEHIGNAAQAFDARAAFTDFVERPY